MQDLHNSARRSMSLRAAACRCTSGGPLALAAAWCQLLQADPSSGSAPNLGRRWIGVAKLRLTLARRRGERHARRRL